jgi:hypothetical protein
MQLAGVKTDIQTDGEQSESVIGNGECCTCLSGFVH